MRLTGSLFFVGGNLVVAQKALHAFQGLMHHLPGGDDTPAWFAVS
jgi:hypothetical protein